MRIGSGFAIRIRIQEAKNYPEKKWINFIYWSAGCSLLRAEGFSCSLDVLYEGLGISKLQFLIKKRKKQIFPVFFSIFCHQNPGSRLGTGSGPESGFPWNAGSGFGTGSGFIWNAGFPISWLPPAWRQHPCGPRPWPLTPAGAPGGRPPPPWSGAAAGRQWWGRGARWSGAAGRRWGRRGARCTSRPTTRRRRWPPVGCRRVSSCPHLPHPAGVAAEPMRSRAGLSALRSPCIGEDLLICLAIFFLVWWPYATLFAFIFLLYNRYIHTSVIQS